MNLPLPWLAQWPSVMVVLISWAMSAVIETAVWYSIIRNKVGSSKFISILGWMTLVQAVSTPLSFGTALILHGFQLGLLPLPRYIDMIFNAISLAWNPIGVIIGFCVIPVLFEFGLWRYSLNWTSRDENKSVIQLKTNLSLKILVSGAIAANIISFFIGVLVFLDINSSLTYSLIFWGLFLIIPLGIVFLQFIVTNVASGFRGYSKEKQESPQKQANQEYWRMIPSRRSSILSKRNLFLVLNVIAIGVFFTYLLIASPAIEGIPPSHNTGPTRQQAVLDDNGQLHVIWEDITILPNGSVRLTIKYRYYDGQTWSQESSISNPRSPIWYSGWGGLSYLISPTTLSCSNNGQLAVGWIHMNGSSQISYTGTAYYRIYDGTEWSALQTLPNSSNIEVFKLQYSKDGKLFALWLDHKFPLDPNYWQLHWWEVGTNPSQILVERNTSQGYPRFPKLLPGNEGHLYAVWEQVAPENMSNYIYFTSYQNETWSMPTLVSDPTVDVGQWDAIITTNETIHVVWVGWQDYNAILYHRAVHDDILGPITTISDKFGGAWYTEVAADSNGDLHVMWLGHYDQYPYTYNYYSCKKIDSIWQECKPIINLHRRDGESTNLVMSTATRSHVIQRQPVGRSAQLVHYQIESDVAIPQAIIASSVPALVFRLQLYAIAKGFLLVIGVIIFLPLAVHLLRRSMHRLTI